jgi:SEC-C motif-containing protein
MSASTVEGTSRMKRGRNDPCPCGSGRKYKYCCLSKDTAPSPDELLWRRLRRDLEGLLPELLGESLHHFGRTGVEEAWDEFNLWPETDEPEELQFDENSPYAPLFLSWYVYDWLPDPPDTAVPERARESTAARPYLKRKGARLTALQRDYIEACMVAPFSFHEVLRCEPGRGFRLRDVLTGTEAEVRERSGSEGVEPGDLLYAKIVPVEGVALMEACAPVVIPPQYKIQLIELRRKLSAASALSPAGLREYDMEVRDVLLPMMDRLLYPKPPAVANTDGDPLEFHTLRFELHDPTVAVAQLRDLAAGVEEEDFESGIERDASGQVVRAEISWLRAGSSGAAMQNTVLGSIRVEAGRLSAEVNSAKRAAALRALIEQRLPEARMLPSVVQSSYAMIEEAHARAVAGGPLPREAEQERLMAMPEVQAALRETLRRHYRSWPDEQLPALGGRTPREAVQDAEGREAVQALLRQFERDMAREDPALNAGIVDELRATLGLG